MSDFSELIKNFDKIRDYMRDFYVYGFKSRDDFNRKSLRSYDNEKRRIESYLSEYMAFRQSENGKNVFISVDSGTISHNPIYRAFKAKSFTKNDITLHFFILDILSNATALSASEITDIIARDYLYGFENPVVLDLSTVRKKLSEYVELGILQTAKDGKRLLFSLNTNPMDVNALSDALMFFSEVCPIGVAGSFLLDKIGHENKYFSFKHHYIMHALESEILFELLEAIHNHSIVEIINHSPRGKMDVKSLVVPLKILISVQGGRRYLSAFNMRLKAIQNYRLDYIKAVKVQDKAEDFTELSGKLDGILQYAWGASFGKSLKPEHLEMKLNIDETEKYIIHRINREGRHGKLTQIDETIYLFCIDTYDTMEMLPWIRTFIGRIISIECTNQEVVDLFYNDLEKTYQLYGGGDNAI